jgi:hypothetical protein
VGSFLRSGSAQSLGVVAVTLANLATLEALYGRAAYNHALYVSAGRLRRCTPRAPSSAGWAMTASWCWCARKTPNS